MKTIEELPNIGKTLSEKLKNIGVTNQSELVELGSENAIIQIATLENSGACLNMLYALEGAIQGIRWHGLAVDRKQELKDFFRVLEKDL